MDSTMIEQECIDELADMYGVGSKVKKITTRAMNGDLGFQDALNERVALLAQCPNSIIEHVLERRITFRSGGKALVSTMKSNGAYTALVSGGFTAFSTPVSEILGFDEHHANILVEENGIFTGQVADPILGRNEKVNRLNRLVQDRGLSHKDVLAVGDGANDLGFINPSILMENWNDSSLNLPTEKNVLRKNNDSITFCISTYNNLEYLKIAVDSVRNNSYYKDSPFIVHAENCSDGTDEWLKEFGSKYSLEYYIDKNDIPLGIGGGMNFCANRVKTEFIMFLHSDFYVTENWDKTLMDVFDKYPNEKMWVNSHRVEPNMFNNPVSRPGTVIVPKDIFGAYHHDFNKEHFENWAQEFITDNDFEIPKGEGVSGLIRKIDWDEIGGNDPLFAPSSWDDMDLFLRMLKKDFKFVLTSKSLVWHFGARGSHRLEENEGKTSERQKKSEYENRNKWLQKWKSLPAFDEYEMIKGLQ
jgi:phosphoserine phosphatase SerB